jgi:hypothetical protein
MWQRPTRSRVVIAGLLLALIVGGGTIWFVQGEATDMAIETPVTAPSDAELHRFAATRVFFGHQSVGANVISGVESIYAASEVQAPLITETRAPGNIDGGVLAHAYIGANGDPLGKFADFKAAVNGSVGQSIDVALLKLCYVDVVASTDVQALFDTYRATMEELEREHPSVRFIYTTVPLTTDRDWKSTIKYWLGRDDHMGPADNLARERYNELIRRQYRDTGRLFDIASIEATMSSSPTQRQSGEAIYYVLNAGLAVDPGHLNQLGASLAGAEFVRVIAAIGAE